MNTKKIIISSVAAGILGSTSLVNAGEIEANVSLATDYVFRGFSQTNEDPAISGGFDYGFDGTPQPRLIYMLVTALMYLKASQSIYHIFISSILVKLTLLITQSLLLALVLTMLA